MSKRISDLIIQRNANYDAATPEKKRVMLAEEVLRLIDTGVALPEYGTYCRLRNAAGYEFTESAQPYIAEGGIRCDVCAKGAIFLAGISFKNQFAIAELHSGRMGDMVRSNRCAAPDDRLALVELFGQDVLDDMESDFECERFEGVYTSDRAQLIRIMTNIIENNGTYTGIRTEPRLTTITDGTP